ncbi:calmodulin-lysine N-methyltransferase-like isoform X2 [Chenopodium quinoa]|uniref:Calmodulin-lysine N-methyltransferase n=1 Tax=Chenopodium quinoa TaxID=63459 RepID=A0A803MHM7_CHEQI|nr:calmodulin-lysine N-methyltransferase-like isoform X1 [Chenopodium quinoa]XP_021727583.1 calmodulin-lysine N-methyltransferase-like isoform X2 [Chenopodium quinoa]
MEECNDQVPKPSTLRWKILRNALLCRSQSDEKSESQEIINRISRKGKGNQSFDLIPCHLHPISSDNFEVEGLTMDACYCYSLPTSKNIDPNLFLFQRRDNCASISDFEICNKYDIDNTGVVCPWPSEEVLSYFCLSHADMFRSKSVIELGAGYGLAGLVIAAASEASEVVISDGNPQVIDYIQRSIAANPEAFGSTNVTPKLLHWNQDEVETLSHKFDIVIASDCTFFKKFHKGLVRTVKLLLKDSCFSEAIFFSPKRGDSLDKFLEEITKGGLRYSMSDKYDDRVWMRHQELMKGDQSWPNYEANHCYPLLLKISR